MNLHVSYLGRSSLRSDAGGLALALAPNLRRDRVAYHGTLRRPLHFREAVSALHDVVISDLRRPPPDRTAHEAYLQQVREREAALSRSGAWSARQRLFERGAEPLPPGLEERYRELRRLYWSARTKYAAYLAFHDWELWRLLMPCDPVITVAPDVVFLECFSKDESSYGCLTVRREAFAGEEGVALGTTNVDYSWALFEEFQKLRSYRETRFRIDPAGFEVKTGGHPDYREEKIDLPTSWLSGFLQLQAAMSLPARRVSVGREGLYNVLAWLQRHRARRSPRAVRFELEPGRPVALVLEPWERRIVLHDRPYLGPRSEVIRTWGRDRLHVLERLLPLAEGVEVHLLGTGLPAFWSLDLGDMRFLLGLSGWTANDWTGPTSLDQLAPPVEPSAADVASVAATFRDVPALSFEAVCRRAGLTPALAAVGLNRLAGLGQVIHDLAAGLYRWRCILPAELALEQAAPESPETAAGRQLVAEGKVTPTRDERSPSGLRVLCGLVPERPVEAVLDADDRILRGKCSCSHHHQFGLRRGPCRHLQALRRVALGESTAPTLDDWFRRLWN